ncbi:MULTISPECIES: hypothetical protein [unclassified Coleofasciculus]|uniref:WD40 domain-containing protein n=1 Tax=unclassified Coleofasciculus TaxID=2692782 RepID=UPI001880B647|nr:MULTISPECIES: hypothetical protein [unclassified Coleofasciculus]MBE9128850.1 hypothetical protein [Coleofasciculus sp. LEGE 07081]MBE9151526.1 hypothetical protein [Coleofasciculus sp. LEGE 07092]
MKEQDRSADIAAFNERSLVTLARAITLSQGQFALILVRCNYQLFKQKMWQQLQVLTEIPLRQLVLQESVTTLYTVILNAIADDQTSALLVFGLELVTEIDQVLVSTNQVRDEFSKTLTFPLVLWVTDEVLQKLTRFAPDFKSWAATSIKFELSTDDLLGLWQQTTDELFSKILASEPAQFLPNEAFNLASNCRRRRELESALRDLQTRGVSLEPAQYATWQFIRGRDAFSLNQIDVALEEYQRSLDFWQQFAGELGSRGAEELGSGGAGEQEYPSNSPVADFSFIPSLLERRGILLHHIAWCYCRQAQLQPSHKYRSWERAREFFSASIEVFTAARRSDWVTQLTLQLGEVLQNLENWTDLQALALQALAQPQTQNSLVAMPQAYGFLAAVALQQSHWDDAKVLAQTALSLLEQSQSPQPQHRGWYLLILAKAQRQLGELSAALAGLEEALKVDGLSPTSPEQPPQLYLDILEELRSLYLEKKQYLRAFELKQQQRAIEQQHGFFTFLGAAPLQPQWQERRLLPLEIAAAGRLPDVNRLLERLSRNDRKLTIIHGSSGVGKSSLIDAGLIPALETRIISAREVIPVVQKVYRDWVNELARLLTNALGISHGSLIIPRKQTQMTALQTLLEQLRVAAEQNLLTVLIFDQFEEFFFVCTNLDQRRQFYDFLESCLNLPFVKIILSLREDYLHYLLECERYSNLSAINSNILDRQLRYHLGDLSPSEAKNVICTLAASSQFKLEDSLIEALVQDLALPSGLVRLIELQVVGTQLQAEKICTLAQYQGLGAQPKTALVKRWLLSAISDCGLENQDMAWQVLFSLTDDKGIRPAKTQVELEQGIKEGGLGVGKSVLSPMSDSGSPICLILKILVGSGLLFRLPDEPQDRYQLVHDYLVKPIRQQYKQRKQLKMLTQLKTSQIELLRVRKQRLQAVAVGTAMAVLAITAGGLGWRAEGQRRLAAALSFNAQLSAISASSEALFAANKTFDALLEALRAAKRLKQVEITEGVGREKEFFPIPHFSPLKVKSDTRLQVIAALSQGIYSVLERNRLEGHTDVVWDVRFSPDGQRIASASRDYTVKLWRPDGSLVTTLKGHKDSVTSVAFSPDGQVIASGSWDGTVRLWSRDGTLKNTLRGHVGRVYSVSFSPNGQWVASAGSSGTIRLWTIEGQLIQEFQTNQGEVQGVSFSPNSEIIASAGKDWTIKLWTPKGKLLKTIAGHQGKVNCVEFSPDGQLLASASDDRTVKLWTPEGKLLKTLSQHERWVLKVAFSQDSQFLASASADNTVRLWNRDGVLLETFRGHSDSVTAVSFSSQSPVPLIASASYDKTIKLWDFRQQSHLILRGHQDDVRDVDFSADGTLIATASNDGTVKIWNPMGQLLHTLKGHTERVYGVSFSPDSLLIASASRDGTVRLWNRQGTLIKTLKGHSDWVLNASFSPDSQRLASASRDGTVKLWTRQGRLIKTLKGHETRVNTVSFSPDGQLLASGSDDRTVKLWTAGGKLLKTLRGHSNWVLDVSFSPDSQLLASASYDNTVKLWHRDGTLETTLKGPTDSVARARFNPTGTILATTSWDNRVQLWRLDDTLIKTWEVEEGRVTDVSWSSDGKALAVASEDNTAMVWNLNLDDLWERSCKWLQDYLHNNPDVKQSDRALCQPIEMTTQGHGN